MYMLKYFLVICSFIIGSLLNAQTEVDTGYFDLQKLRTTKPSNLDQLNSEQFEFSPVLYLEDMVFVQSNTEKKRFRIDPDNSFMLRHAAKSADNTFLQDEAFSGISMQGFFDGPASFSPDGQWLFVTRNQSQSSRVDGKAEQKLGIFIYAKKDNAWVSKGGLPLNAPRYNVCHPHWDMTTKKLYFASDMPGGFGGLDLYSIQMTGEDTWGEARNLGARINSDANDCFPYLNQQHFMFFTTDRKGSKGGFDLYASVVKNGKWGQPVNLEGLNTPSDDLCLMLDETGKSLYFASSRAGGKGKDDLYLLQLEQNFILKSPEYITIRVLNRENNQPVEGVKMLFKPFNAGDAEIVETKDERLSLVQEIEFKNAKENELYTSDKKGVANLYLPKEPFVLIADKTGYGINRRLLDFSKGSRDYTVYLDSIVCKGFEMEFVDGQSGEKLSVFHVEPVSTMQFIMGKEGAMVYCLAKGQEFLGEVTSEGYYPRDFRILFDDIADKDKIRIGLDKIPVVENNQKLPMKAGETIVLRQIYYDYNSAEIKTDAVQTLDQLANHMLRYPGMVIELSAHTDARGKESYNQSLSLKRANNAKLYLTDKGIPGDRIVAVGYGESRLLNKCKDGVKCSEEAHALNRRTEVKVISHEEGLEFRYNGQ
jgi:outer membrane protein OmpA-like peptidoglycan-associated protein